MNNFIRSLNTKLPAFWLDAPVAWFAAVEAQFKLHRVSSHDKRFCHVTEKEKYPTAPVSLARDSAGLCFYHWSFGKRANNCTAPCSWQGN